METAYDWITVFLFGGIAILYLQRSVGPPIANDRILAYLPAALGCAAANFLGNGGWHLVAVMLLVATVAYILVRLRPWAGE